jgi:hypothetical protein
MPQARATAATNAILYQSHRCETGVLAELLVDEGNLVPMAAFLSALLRR